MALTDKLTAIGDAIREKTGGTDLIPLADMPEEIKGISGGGGDFPEVVIGNLESEATWRSHRYSCVSRVIQELILAHPEKFRTENLTGVMNMFASTNDYGGSSTNNWLTHIPMDINFAGQEGGNITHNGTNQYASLEGLFQNCYYLTTLPKVNAPWIGGGRIPNYLSGCQRLREINPEGYENINFEIFHKPSFSAGECSVSAINTQMGGIFYNCHSLRRIPHDFLKELWSYTTSYSYFPYYQEFCNCYVLDEAVDIPVCPGPGKNSNIFNSTFSQCHRLKRLTFETNEDGTPKTAQWSNATITLNTAIGNTAGTSASYTGRILNYNSGITNLTKVTDDESYAALKDSPDWWSVNFQYSRYNHDSAVETINSLPDVSDYGTMTLSIYGRLGERTDGGAVNTLTDEEIAVATEKGWTVTIT